MTLLYYSISVRNNLQINLAWNANAEITWSPIMRNVSGKTGSESSSALCSKQAVWRRSEVCLDVFLQLPAAHRDSTCL